jgi:hypothetical protein
MPNNKKKLSEFLSKKEAIGLIIQFVKEYDISLDEVAEWLY